MSRQHEHGTGSPGRPAPDLDTLLGEAQDGILAAITQALDVQSGLAAITGPAATWPSHRQQEHARGQAAPPAAGRSAPGRDPEHARARRLEAVQASPHGGAGFETGEQVVITSGPFAELPATVIQADREARMLKVRISVFGRETPVDVTFDQVARTPDDVG